MIQALNITKKFDNIIAVDNVTAEIKNGTVFSKDKEILWMCRECGYVYKGKSAPKKCPNCHHPQGYFQVMCENY